MTIDERLKKAALRYKRERDRLRAENAKLREMLAKARDPQRIGGTADPESFVYAIEQLREFRWQHATNDEDAIPYINNVADAHERENAKLRELLQDYHRYEHKDCYACRYINECRADDSGRCIAPVRLGERYRELGIGVGE